MSSQYEEMIVKMLQEAKSKLKDVEGRTDRFKEKSRILHDIVFLEKRLSEYRGGVAYFRTPKAAAGPSGEESVH